MEFFKKYIDVIVKFFKKEYLIAIMLSCGIMLFVPKKIILALGVDSFIEKYRSEIGIFFLFTCVLTIIWIIQIIKKEYYINPLRHKRVARTYLTKLISEEEKEFLIDNFYDEEEKRFSSTALIDMSDGCVLSLERSYIIYRSSSVAISVWEWAYNLHIYARQYLNNAVENEKIVISENGIKWEL